MRVQKINRSFAKYTDADFQQKALHIITSMTGNANFPTPAPTLADVQAAYDAYASALNAAATLDRQAVSDKNAARQNLELILNQLACYVMNVANGDENMLVSSGFTLTKYPLPQALDSPGNVTLTYGINPGELTSQVPKQNGRTFNHQITDTAPTDSTVWTNYSVSTSKYTFTGLIPGKQYWVRVAALGSRKQIAYSTVATQFASL